MQIIKYDGSTGEMSEQVTERLISWGQEPDYVKLYLQDILYLFDMPAQYLTTLMALLKRMNYAGEHFGMCVMLLPAIKREICEELEFQKRQSLDNALQKLLKGKILYRVDKGIYRLNPHLFGRGDWKDIARLRLKTNHDVIDGRTFRTVVESACHTTAKKGQESATEGNPKPKIGDV